MGGNGDVSGALVGNGIPVDVDGMIRPRKEIDHDGMERCIW